MKKIILLKSTITILYFHNVLQLLVHISSVEIYLRTWYKPGMTVTIFRKIKVIFVYHNVISSTNKTYRHHITKLLLKVVLSTIKLTI